MREMVSRGGFGATYLIEDVDLFNEMRILKELRPLAGEGSGAAARVRRETAERLFRREAETLLKLNHSGIPKLYAYFVEDNYSYLLQEYIPGKTLVDELEERGENFSEREARDFLMELAEILRYLHSQDPPIIHRDVKPQNLMRHSDGHLLLIDFGAVCRAARQGGRGQTLIGSPGYAPPEQILGRPLPQSDLYAAGATVVRLITGVHPTQLTNRKTERLEWEPSIYVSRQFGELIDALLVRDPQLRIPSASALIDALKSLSTVPCVEVSCLRVVQLPEEGEGVTTTSITHTELSKSGSHAKLSSCPSLITALRSTFEVEQGELSAIPVPVLLFKIYQKRIAGTLTLMRTGVVKTVSFDAGSIVFATSSLDEERLGVSLVRQGRISPEQYSEAEALMEQTGQRLGTAMLQLGMIEQDELLDIIVEHVSSIV
ncbi:MAG: protein kinase, partial [Candidatus Bathyarchaeia archaeon]